MPGSIVGPAGAQPPSRDAFGDVNSDVLAERDVVARFAQASTWLDPGERRSIEAAAERRPTGRVLDIGVGAGRTVELMRRFGPGY
jgi:hypothetical protein